MLKDILKLEGAKQLDKKGQNEISGGHGCPIPCDCPPGYVSHIDFFTGTCSCIPE